MGYNATEIGNKYNANLNSSLFYVIHITLVAFLPCLMAQSSDLLYTCYNVGSTVKTESCILIRYLLIITFHARYHASSAKVLIPVIAQCKMPKPLTYINV